MPSPYSFRNEDFKLPLYQSSEETILATLHENTIFKALVQGRVVYVKIIGYQNSTKFHHARDGSAITDIEGLDRSASPDPESTMSCLV